MDFLFHQRTARSSTIPESLHSLLFGLSGISMFNVFVVAETRKQDVNTHIIEVASLRFGDTLATSSFKQNIRKLRCPSSRRAIPTV